MKDEQLETFFSAGPVSSMAFANFFKLPGIPKDFNTKQFRAGPLGSNRARNNWVYEQLFLKLGTVECSALFALYEIIKAPRFCSSGYQEDLFVGPFWVSAKQWIVDYVSFRASRLNSENARIMFIYSLAAFFEEFEKTSSSLLGKTTVSYNLTGDHTRSDNFCSFNDLQNYCDVLEKTLPRISPAKLQHHVEEIEKRPASLAYLMVRLFRKSFQMRSNALDGNSPGLYGDSLFHQINTLSIHELLKTIDLTTRGMDLGLGSLSYGALEDILGGSEIRGLERRK